MKSGLAAWSVARFDQNLRAVSIPLPRNARLFRYSTSASAASTSARAEDARTNGRSELELDVRRIAVGTGLNGLLAACSRAATWEK